MLVRQYVSKGVCRCWHCRVSTAWPWELIDSHGVGTFVCPFTTGRGIGTETCEMDNVFLPEYDSLYEYIYIYIYIIYIYTYTYNCVLGSLISDVTCNYVSADGGKRWSVVACPSRELVVLYRMLTSFTCYVLTFMFKMLFLFLTASLGYFVHGFCFSNNGLNMLPWT